MTTTRDYRDTLSLPNTSFPMRANLPQKEPQWLKFWQDMNLFERLRNQSRDHPSFCLHDGPPYANGHIHMGTALNKILKDMINRAHQMAGFNAHYVPGWDCHGLPIEWKVEEEFRGQGRQKKDVPAREFRTRCRTYAQHWLNIQKQEFIRLGIIGDWAHPYQTMDFQSEADICAELLKIAASAQLYRGSKPVMWSPVEQTALAEAEVEYKDRKTTQIHVRFPIRKGEPEEASIVIWTTTPWTIPANRAVCYNPDIAYGLYEVTALETGEITPWARLGEHLIVGDKLWPMVAQAGLIKSARRLRDITPQQLAECQLEHPLRYMSGAEHKYDFIVPLLPGTHVTDEAGTGFVHTAPSHGEDDYTVWITHQAYLENLGLDAHVPITLDDAGCYTDIMPARFAGLDIIRTHGKKRGQDGQANEEVIKALLESGQLLARSILTLRDAHSWRSKAPVLRRATPQWFISMSRQGLRDKALTAIEQTRFWPKRSRNRFTAMVKDRPDWLISRQRAWGVPMTLFVHKDGRLHTERPDAETINRNILSLIEKAGVDGWFETPTTHFISEDPEDWEKVTDILDVWFDSGSTHAFCLKRRTELPDRADLYLEGSDQHRGWFQSSLLQSCAIYDEAPFEGILTHGFVVDEKGYKMSKSLNNTLSPEEITKQYGAEILRLWTASSDWADDLKIGREIIQTNVEAYRKLRNCLRYILGALAHYDPDQALAYEQMPALERWVLHRLTEIDSIHHKAVLNHNHKAIFSTLFQFCTQDLSALYFDIRKDSLYCDPPESLRRRACLTVMEALFTHLSTWLAPILCFTCEEVWQARYNDSTQSVHLQNFPRTPKSWHDVTLIANMQHMRNLRTKILETIEPLRQQGIIKSSLEASVNIQALDAQTEASLQALLGSHYEGWAYTDPLQPSDLLADYLIVSQFTHTPAKGELKINITPLTQDQTWRKCARSWRYFKPQTTTEHITSRDQHVVHLWDSHHG